MNHKFWSLSMYFNLFDIPTIMSLIWKIRRIVFKLHVNESIKNLKFCFCNHFNLQTIPVWIDKQLQKKENFAFNNYWLKVPATPPINTWITVENIPILVTLHKRSLRKLLEKTWLSCLLETYAIKGYFLSSKWL